ncbi:MAG: CPBP family intramembrane glutamic endopeptidase [Acidobacteriaceae bacterium]
MASSSGIDIQGPPQSAPRRIAPLWHTILLIVLLAAFSFGGAHSSHPIARQQGLAPQYLSMIIVEWLTFGYVVWGIRRGGVLGVRELIGGRWEKVEDFLLDVGIATAFWILSVVVLAACAYPLGIAQHGGNLEEVKRLLGFLVPRTNLEIALWFCVAGTAGFCEEIIFRGYIQRQFSTISGYAIVGMLVSAITFGMAHGYEGPRRMVLISVYGLLFSALAAMWKSLRPGMMAHAWHDAFTGMMMRVLFR